MIKSLCASDIVDDSKVQVEGWIEKLSKKEAIPGSVFA
jgi:hypothetical protein